ncbi:MAG: hypothetical protein WBO55_13015 [Rhizobiaceae bacterium]
MRSMLISVSLFGAVALAGVPAAAAGCQFHSAGTGHNMTVAQSQPTEEEAISTHDPATPVVLPAEEAKAD